ncbi:MAG: hypothetical protein C0504_03475 [Candidatus Solibacter sp.]|nr:hypothetical protein [Candidatus Solibacter sp.]
MADVQPHPRDQYTPAAVAACERALLTVVTKIGPWGERLVLIGGLVPRYLVGLPPPGVATHVGTTDLDIVVGFALSAEEAEVYRTLQSNLKDAGFAPALDPETGSEQTFRWERDVDGVSVCLEFFCPVGDGQPGRLLRSPGGTGSRISAVRTRGAELAARDCFSQLLTGRMLDSGAVQQDTPIRVTNLLPFLVLKAFALDERDKAKDSYDLVWTLAGFGNGPRSAVQAMAQSPVIRSPDVPLAIDALRRQFKTIEHRGAVNYARFQSRNLDPDEAARHRRYAHGTIDEFLRYWETMGLPG